MQTVKTLNTDVKEYGWVFYDGACRFCRRLARQWGPALERRRFRLAPLQTPWVAGRLGISGPELLREMRVLTPEGKLFGGADAIVELSRGFWWARWLALAARIPCALKLLQGAYRWVAARRHCDAGACATGAKGVDVLPLLILTAAAAWLTVRSPGWVRMWSVAVALFAGVKWLAWRDGDRGRGGMWRTAGFFVLWPGMDARRFLDPARGTTQPGPREWMTAFVKTLLGGVLIWILARPAYAVAPLLAGWVGMIGLVMFLHFGVFQLLSLAWRTGGVDAAPIMNAPLRGDSLAEFWGQRWNLGFSGPARRFLHRPLAAGVGNSGALLGVFLVSGVFHELVISFPARAGYGLPTAYFALQGFAMIVERGALGWRLGLGSGRRGWVFMVLSAAVPAFWLFHPAFVHRVILPFLQTIGAI